MVYLRHPPSRPGNPPTHLAAYAAEPATAPDHWPPDVVSRNNRLASPLTRTGMTFQADGLGGIGQTRLMAGPFILIPGRTARQGCGISEGKFGANYQEETNLLQVSAEDMQRLRTAPTATACG